MNQGARTNRQKAVERAREVVELREQGLAYEEIATILGISEEVARQRVSRQRRRSQPTVPRYSVRRTSEQR